ncbi:MAG: OmpH family outer membrane protein [Betaproteobacteria bacterium]|nr:OmpH family outer membrane protein [Betaproteobacteria bacterium]
MNPFRICLIAAAAVIATAASAQEKPAPASGKVGYINSERVMLGSRTTRKSKQDLDDKYQKVVKEIEAGPKDQIDRRKNALVDDMALEREDALRQFVERTNRIIRQIAMDENFDAVFIEAAFASARVDLTDKVIKELDAGR